MKEIRVITKSDNDGFVPVLEPQWVVLGMLNEYLGRSAIDGGDTVERFFVDERPLADLFAKYLTLYANSIGVDPSGISVVRVETGHSYVTSAAMNARVNALYRFNYELDRLMTMPDGKKLRFMQVALDIEDFPKRTSMLYQALEMNPRFSYLYGVFLRFGLDGLVVKMANASRKIELIKRVLEEVDVEWVEHRYWLGGAPTVSRIAFGADERLSKFLQSALVERASAFAAETSAQL